MSGYETINLENLSFPSPLIGVNIRPSHSQIFMFSAATWNRHQIHYNINVAKDEGHKDILVQRALIGNFMSKLLKARLAHCASIRKLSWKVLASALPNEDLISEGTIVSKEKRDEDIFLNCELRILKTDSTVVATGTAKLQLKWLIKYWE